MSTSAKAPEMNSRPGPTIGLSTASVYTETTANGFELGTE